MKTKPLPAVLALHAYAAREAAELSDSFEIVEAGSKVRDAALASMGPRILAVIAVGKEKIDASLLDRMPNLRMIVVMGAGYDGIDLEAARARNVTITSAGAGNGEDVADHAVALTLAARKTLLAGDDWVRSGRWREQIIPIGRSLSNERVGIIGMGDIGRAVARKIEPFCGEIGWWGPNPQQLAWKRHASLLALAQWSDILVLAARGDESTRGLVTGAVLEAIGPDGLFVNVARGYMVDEDALIAALDAGRLGQAALDVFAEEPADPARWKDVPNVLLSPHAAGYTSERMEAARTCMIGNIRCLLTGETPRNIIA